MLLIPENDSERELLWRRADAVRYVLGGGVNLRIADADGAEISRLSQPATVAAAAIDRRIRRRLLLRSSGQASSSP